MGFQGIVSLAWLFVLLANTRANAEIGFHLRTILSNRESSQNISAEYETQNQNFRYIITPSLDLHQSESLNNIGLAFSINRIQEPGPITLDYGLNLKYLNFYNQSLWESSAAFRIGIALRQSASSQTKINLNAISNFNSLPGLSYNGVGVDMAQSWMSKNQSYSVGGHLTYRRHTDIDQEDIDFGINGSALYRLSDKASLGLTAFWSDGIHSIERNSKREHIESQQIGARVELLVDLQDSLHFVSYLATDATKMPNQSSFIQTNEIGIQLQVSF